MEDDMTNEVKAVMERCASMVHDNPDIHDWDNVSSQCVRDMFILMRAYLADRTPEREAERRELVNTLTWELDDYESDITISHHDARRLRALLMEPTT